MQLIVTVFYFIQMTAADEDDLAGLQDVSSEDEDYCYEDDFSDEDSNIAGNGPGKRGQFSKKKGRGMFLKLIVLCFCLG